MGRKLKVSLSKIYNNTCCLLAPVSAAPSLAAHLVTVEAPGLAWSRGPSLDHGGEESSSEPVT